MGSAEKRMTLFKKRKEDYPDVHPNHRRIFLNEAGLDLYMAAIYGQNERNPDKFEALKQELKNLKGE